MENKEPEFKDLSDKELSSPESNVDNDSSAEIQKKPRSGGMYRGVKIPVKVLNWGIVIGIMALALTIIILASTGGYTITFDSKGGTEVQSQRLKYGNQLVEPETPEKAGYAFDGWFYDEEYKTKWNFETDTVNATRTLYAKWSPISVSVRFDTAGGDGIDPVQVTFGEPYGELPTPVREGYEFDGWYYEDNLITEESIVETNGEHVLTARWKS